MSLQTLEATPKSTPEKFKHIYIGSIDPRITDEMLKSYFQKKNLKLSFPKKRGKRSKNYKVGKTSDDRTYKYLTQVKKEHTIGKFTVVTDEFLKGEEKIKKDVEEARRKIYIGDVPKVMKDRDIKNHFSTFGKVKVAYIKKKARGVEGNLTFGFVIFEDEEVVKNLIKKKFTKIAGNKILLKPFESKWNRVRNFRVKKKPIKEEKLDKKVQNFSNFQQTLMQATLSFNPLGLFNNTWTPYTKISEHSKILYEKNEIFEKNFLSDAYNQNELLEFVDKRHRMMPRNFRINRSEFLGLKKAKKLKKKTEENS